METNKTINWREKFLTLSEDLETAEQRHAQQLEQLRRTLVRVSLAADGLDQELDQVLAVLREQLKKSDLAHLGQYLARVEETMLAFEQRKDDRQSQMYQALEQVCQQLEAFELDRPTKQKLKTFVKKLHARLANQEEYVAICQELAEIHGLALKKTAEQTESKPAGLLNRFLGLSGKTEAGSESPPETQPQPETQQSSTANTKKNIDGVFDAVSSNAKSISSTSLSVEQPQTARLERDTGAVIDLTDLANRVQTVLHRLLDDIEPAECVAQKINNARERVARGLNWQDFVPTLEDVRDLIMQSHIAANVEFITYLKTVDDELIAISNLLRATGATAGQQEETQLKLEKHLTHQLNQLTTDVDSAVDLNSLKLTVNQRIQDIHLSLQKPEQKTVSISTQIKELLQQVEKLETEAKETYASLNEQREKAHQDTLTGLPNREAYNERSYQEWLRWTRYKKPVSLGVIDIDYFKKVNDTYGHQTGDKVLQLVGRELAKRLREVDFIARYGGEEFVVLLPETDKKTAVMVLDKLREKLAEIPFHFKEQPVSLSVSIGVAEFVLNDTVDAVFERADAALYRAKESGRNRCCADDTEEGLGEQNVN